MIACSTESDCVRVCKTKCNRIIILCAAIVAVLAVGFLLFRLHIFSSRELTQDLDINLLPVPMRVSIRSNHSDWPNAARLSPDVRDYDDIFGLFGFETGGEGLPVIVETDLSLEEEAYRLSVTRERVAIAASGRQGVFTAVSTLAQLVSDGRIAAAEIEDKPSIPYRGVIEGFYGTPWTHAFRFDLFSFMGKYKLNTYIYAPKSDPKHREEWRSLYTDEERRRIKELVDCAAENNVRFVYAISPGLDMDLGAGYEQDFEKLIEKCASVYTLGVRDFAVLLDDISTYDAKGHAVLFNDFQRKFIKTHIGCSNLIIIAPEYCNHFMTEYTDALTSMLDPEIVVMWTGSSVTSSTVSASDLSQINAKLKKNVFVWWNYPVNDMAPDELHLGPCVNLDPKLFGSVSGFVSNPMNQGYASLLPLLTIADYLWNPSAYDPETSVNNAVKRLAPECAEGMYSLMDLTRGSVINEGRSAYSLTDEIEAFNNGKNHAAEKLRSKLVQMKGNLNHLSESGEKKLVRELSRWIEKSLSCLNAAIALTDFETAKDDNERIEHALSFVQAYREATENSAVISTDVLMPFLYSAKEKINSILEPNASGTGRYVHTALTDMPTYQSNVPSNAVDGESGTFFWSAGAPSVGDCFTVDLGETLDILGVRLAMGGPHNKNDLIRNGVIEYSADGEQFTYLCDTTGRETVCKTPFNGRYVRVRCTESQTNWVMITAFDVQGVYSLPERVSFDGSNTTDLSSLFDGNLFSFFQPDQSEIAARTISIDTTGLESVELYALNTEDVHVYKTDRTGDSTEEVSLSDHTVIDVKSIQALCITFDDAAHPEIAEIVLR